MLGRIARSQRGAFMVFFAILVPFFLGMIGFAVDAGFVYMQKAKMQDIADAAALAGAARLNDGSDVRGGYVTSAVRAYADANGMKTTGTNVLNLNQEGSMAPSKNNFEIAQGILTSVMDKDNVRRDHVRVVIAKRVPTFFIGLLLPEEKEEGVLVKAAAEAEYVEGEEAPVVYDGPRVFCSHYEQDIYDNKTIVVNKGQDFSMFVNSTTMIYDKIPYGSTGTLYNVSEDKNGLPDGWDLVRVNKPGWTPTTEKEKEEKKIGEEMMGKYNSLVALARDESSKIIAKKREYMYPSSDSNKRFIGRDDNGKVINNIKENDKVIELYMAGTDDPLENWISDYWCYLTDRQLKNVEKITRLACEKYAIIYTHNKIYGDIYDLYDSGLAISGANNTYTAKIYGGANFSVGGDNNHFLNTASLLASNMLKIGITETVKETYDDGNLKMSFGERIYQTTNPNWHVYFDGSSSGSGSSGSSGSDSGTSAHVRLVK